MDRKKVQHETGTKQAPLLSNLPFYESLYLLFHLPDVAHLSYADICPFIFDLFTVPAFLDRYVPGEHRQLTKREFERFGRLVEDTKVYLPSPSARPLGTPHLKRNTQFKMHE